MKLLNITEVEWKKAEDYFLNNPDVVKMSKKVDPNYPKNPLNLDKKMKPRDTSIHSFILGEDGQIYAIANGEYLGQGGNAKVKLIESRDGTNYAMKVQEWNRFSMKEVLFLEAAGFLKTKAERETLGAMFFGNVIDDKLYTMIPLFNRGDLYGAINQELEQRGVTDTQKYITLIQCAQAIQNLHNLRIIHGDIKLQNFLVDTFSGNDIILAASDFGVSEFLPIGEEVVNTREIAGTYKRDENGNIIRDKTGGSLYVAPEIIDYTEYSFESDVYAFGKMTREFNLPKLDLLCDEMTATDPTARPGFNDIIAELICCLAAESQLDKHAKKIVQDIMNIKFKPALDAFNNQFHPYDQNTDTPAYVDNVSRENIQIINAALNLRGIPELTYDAQLQGYVVNDEQLASIDHTVYITPFEETAVEKIINDLINVSPTKIHEMNASAVAAELETFIQEKGNMPEPDEVRTVILNAAKNLHFTGIERQKLVNELKKATEVQDIADYIQARQNRI